MAQRRKDIVLAPLEDGNQKYAIRSNADVVCFTGNTGGGKSYALYYSPIEYLAMNDNAKVVCFMRNISDFWGAGKVSDTLKKMYPLIDRSVKRQPHDPIGEIIRNTTDMGMKLYNGSEIKFQQLDNENPIVIDKIVKGLQAKKLIFDECNKFLFRTISAFFPRLRSDAAGKAQVFLAQNPERECFLRKLCGKGPHGGGWINDDGTVDKSMDGVVMYFYIHGGDIDKAYFGRTKKEVYEKAKKLIDKRIVGDSGSTYEDVILSMAFYSFDVRDNKKMLAKNKSYRGFAANSSTAESSYAANWNYSLTDEDVDTDDRTNVSLSKLDVERLFRNIQPPAGSRCIKKRMTFDMATTGFDNLVMKYWELWTDFGWWCRDIKFSLSNSNREAVVMAIQFREKHHLKENEMIIDVQGFGFLSEVFPRATKFSGASQPSNRGKTQFKTAKDEAGHVTMEMIQSGLIHYENRLAEMHYTHKNMKREGGTTIIRHMYFESRIFQFGKTPNGRITMLEKDKQKTLLKGMSPDLFDNVIQLCGGTIYDCHRLLSEDAGVSRKRMEASDMLTYLRINNGEEQPDEFDWEHKRKKKIRNVSDEVMSILSTI